MLLKQIQDEQKQLLEQKQIVEQKQIDDTIKKKEEKQLILLEFKQPKPFPKSFLQSLVESIDDFSEYFNQQEWNLLKERKHFNIKEIQSKKQPGKDRYKSSKDKIVRVVENIEIKQLKDRIKFQAEEIMKKINQTPEQRDIIYKEIRYRLNQLAPCNFDMVAQQILQLAIEYTTKNDLTYLEYLSQKIIEKSQTEPKYRKLYTKLCQLLIKEPQLTIVSEKYKGEAKNVSLFKIHLLNQVQQVFYERKNKKEDLSHMTPEDREIYHLIRKSKFTGIVRFIGDLQLSKLLSIQAVKDVIQEFISDFVTQYQLNQENSEESIEGLIELLDHIGGAYKTQNTTDLDILKKDLNLFFDGTTKNREVTQQFLEKRLKKNLSIDTIMEIFNLLISKYQLSQRITMLIENIQEKGWGQDHYSRQDQPQIVKTIQQKQEKEIIEYNCNLSKSKNNSEQSLKPSTQSKQQLFNLNKYAIFIQSTFNMEPQQQEAKLLGELKIIGVSDEKIQNFFDIFMESMLSFKLINQNIERAQMVFELLSKAEAKEEIVQKATQKALNEDKVYDLADSRLAIDLLVNIIGYFLIDSDINSLKKLYFKPEMEIQEFNDFMSKVATQLIIKYSDKEDIIKEYYGILGYSL